MKDTGQQVSFLVLFLSSFGIRISRNYKMNWEVFLFIF